MTPEEFAKKMKEIANTHSDHPYCDVEINHIAMDALMCKCLRLLGYEKGINIFENTEKWYS